MASERNHQGQNGFLNRECIRRRNTSKIKTGPKWINYWSPAQIKKIANEIGFKIEKFREGHRVDPVEILGVEGEVEQENHFVATTLQKSKMFDKLFENIKRVDEMESKLLSIFEGKTWEQIALALYQILDDIDTADDMYADAENLRAFREMVLRLQAKKNQLLYSPGGYTVNRIDETLADRIWDFLRENPDSTFNEILDGIDATSEDAGKFEDVVKDMLNKSIYVEDGKYHVVESLKENLTDFARKELELAGLFDKDSDYDGMLGEAVMELIQKFGEQGHSGMSAAMVRELFAKLSNYKPLSELTDNLDEWQLVTDNDPASSGNSLYQSRRSPSCFSNDEGKTYWDIDEDWNKHEDEDGNRWSGGLSEEEWNNRPMHQSKHIEKEE